MCLLVSDDTQDPPEDEQQLVRVKDWISTYHLDRVEVTDVLSNFPNISVVMFSARFPIKCWFLHHLLARPTPSFAS